MPRGRNQPVRYRWQAAPGWEHVLFGAEGLLLGRWQREGRVRVVKDAPHRFVCRVELPHAVIYVKRYRRRSFGDRVRQFLAVSPARREWANLRELGKRGIPAVEPLAWIEQLEGPWTTDSLLVTRAAEPAFTVQEYLDEHLPRLTPERQRTQTRELAAQLGRLVAALHRAGTIEADLHLGNLLVVGGDVPEIDFPSATQGTNPVAGSKHSPHGPLACCGMPNGDRLPHTHAAGLRLVLVDVRKLRFARRGPVCWRHARRNLVALHAACFDRLSLYDRMQFWRQYVRVAGDIVPADHRRTLGRLWHATLKYARSLALHYDRRARRKDEGQVIRDGDRGVALVFCGPGLGKQHAGEASVQIARLLAEHPCAANFPGKPPGERLAEADRPAAGPLRWTCALLAESAAKTGRMLDHFRRQWLSGLALWRRRIPSPLPALLALSRNDGQHKRGGWHAVHMAAVFPSNASRLGHFLESCSRQKAAAPWRGVAQCAAALGTLVGRLHLWAIRFDRIDLERFLVQEHAGDETARPTVNVYLSGCEGFGVGGATGRAGAIEQLAQLAAAARRHRVVSRTVCLRFLKSYLRTSQQGLFQWKAWWRAVARAF